jgi:hypothetical protein
MLHDQTTQSTHFAHTKSGVIRRKTPAYLFCCDEISSSLQTTQKRANEGADAENIRFVLHEQTSSLWVHLI